ncbi:MAG: tryptophan synthase subunit alpha [Candidatus Wallbacteria bacterium]|nr:tryptophan synthase subunit alpha [Candidatus Wallbacteria bacterium]
MKISEKFQELRKKRAKAFIPYFTAGFPDLKKSLSLLRMAAANGADIIEIGYPFSDPVADGKTIQQSSQSALESGITLPALLSGVKKLKMTVPLILMSYLNPLMAYGEKRIFGDLQAAGFSGLIIPDMPLEETSDWALKAEKSGIALILLAAPNSTPERIKKIADISQGFIYCVSITGVTGGRKTLPAGLRDFLLQVKKCTDKALCLGFGISNPDQAAKFSPLVDGVIVGSRLVEAIKKGEDLEKLIREFKKALL